ncbi:MAG TPA: 2-oxo acid dehydrogenase subunit E2 [Candidatus Hydrogenedentes bacterium]|nr:2-oxo acid dehydrogenase subunit E2 [Candidatus Hydrogenedentota bacterium]HOS03138.1 2-oxo acid dehydrogenase subunit E2 [Candidatus Hydrogenedentota bacterium]
MSTEFRLPGLGENVESGAVTKVMIAVGDTVMENQSVLEIETEKAALEVPSNVSGVVTEVRVKEGDVLRVGQVAFIVEATSVSVDPASRVLPVPEPPEPASVDVPPASETSGRHDAEQALPLARAAVRRGGPVAASPSVRQLAREIGVDINEVPPSEGGRVTAEDVKRHARGANVDTGGAVSRASAPAPTLLPDFTRWGVIERQPMTTVRKRTAEGMTYAWTTIPHVTQFDKADVTELEALRAKYAKRAEKAGGKLTMTAILLKVLAGALKKFPQFNASIDTAANEVILKKYYNIGVAVDTDRGLLVPVIRDVDQKNIIEIAVELNGLAERARTRKATLDEMQGGTFTVSNLGGIGGTAFTPIVNAPEVAILGVSRSQIEPMYIDGRFQPRTMLPLSLSYDHRVIDGADGARFLRWVCEAIEQPVVLFLEG